MDSSVTSVPPPDPAAPAASPAPRRIPVPIAVLILLAIPLAILILWKSYPLNLWFFGCFILWIIPRDERFKDKSWASLLQSLTGPALAALAILTTFVASLTLFDFRTAGAIANWEDRIILSLHSWLRYPTKWQYVGILAIVTLVSWRFPRLKAVGRVKTAKEWLGTAAGLVGVIANVSFLGHQQVVDGRFSDVEYRIEAQYRNADKEKIRHIDRALAIEALTQDLQSTDPATRASLQNSFAALAGLNLPRDYQDALAANLAASVSPPSDSKIEERADLDSRAWKDADAALATATTNEKIAKIQKVQQDAGVARHQETDAESGLRTIVATIIGSENGKLADAAMSFLDPLVQKLSSDMFAPVTDALQDQATDSIKDWLKDREKPLVDDVIARASKTLRWDKLPRSSPQQLAADLRGNAVELAQQRHIQAASALNSIIGDVQSAHADPDDLAQRINTAKAQGIEADQVLGKLGATPPAATGSQLAQDPAVVWDRTAKPAQDAVSTLHQHLNDEEKARELKDRAPAER